MISVTHKCSACEKKSTTFYAYTINIMFYLFFTVSFLIREAYEACFQTLQPYITVGAVSRVFVVTLGTEKHSTYVKGQ